MFPSLGVDPKGDLNFCKSQIMIKNNRDKLTELLAVLVYHVPSCRFV